jgi:hypothetical protein
MNSSRLFIAGLAALAAATVAPATSHAADTLVKIGNQGSGKVLAVEGHNSTERAHVIHETFTGDRSQKWRMRQVATFPGTSKIAFEYRNLRSGKCLDLETSPGTNGTRLVQKSCSNALSQQWIRDFSVNATFLRIENRRTSMFATTSGIHVVQRPLANSSTQFWSVLGTS